MRWLRVGLATLLTVVMLVLFAEAAHLAIRGASLSGSALLIVAAVLVLLFYGLGFLLGISPWSDAERLARLLGRRPPNS